MIWFPLVHLDEEVGVEALEMVAGGGATWCGHPHLPQGTGQGHLKLSKNKKIALTLTNAGNTLQ